MFMRHEHVDSVLVNTCTGTGDYVVVLIMSEFTEARPNYDACYMQTLRSQAGFLIDLKSRMPDVEVREGNVWSQDCEQIEFNQAVQSHDYQGFSG